MLHHMLRAAAGMKGKWTPAEIATYLWLDASDLDTITEVSGLLTNIDDKSGNNRNFSQTTESLRPATGVSTLNGLNILDLDADYMISDSAASEWEVLHNATGFSCFFVVSAGLVADPADLYAVMGTNATATSNKGVSIRYDDRVDYSDSIVHLSTTGTERNIGHQSDNSLPAQSPTIVSIIADPSLASANRSKHWSNGAGVAVSDLFVNTSSTPSGAPTYTLEIGASGNGAFPFKGAFSELVIVSGQVPESDREKMEGYLAHKWGLAANLPAAHPYKSEAP